MSHELSAFNLEDALNGLGLSLYTDEWSARVLAFVHCLNGSDEVVITNPRLKHAIDCAFNKLYPQQRLRPSMFYLMQACITELESHGLDTPWLHEIAARYGLSDLEEMWKRAGRLKN